MKLFNQNILYQNYPTRNYSSKTIQLENIQQESLQLEIVQLETFIPEVSRQKLFFLMFKTDSSELIEILRYRDIDWSIKAIN